MKPKTAVKAKQRQLQANCEAIQDLWSKRRHGRCIKGKYALWLAAVLALVATRQIGVSNIFRLLAYTSPIKPAGL